MIPVLIKMKSGIRIKNFSYPPRWLFNIGGKFLEYTVPYSLTRTTREREGPCSVREYYPAPAARIQMTQGIQKNMSWQEEQK